MIPEFVTTFEYPSTGLLVRLFRNRETGEGIVIAREVAALMEYSSLSFVRRIEDCLEGMHFFVLEGEKLKKFKDDLASQNVQIYRQANHLLFLTETGVCFLLGRYCKEKAMRVGEWLLSRAFPRLRPRTTGMFYQKVKSRYLNCEFEILAYEGRFAIFSSHIFTLLGVPALDHIAKGVHAYVPDIHLALVPELCEGMECPGIVGDGYSPENWVFYESGLYRYWRHIRHPLVPLMKKAFEREIWPCFRLGQWSAVPDKGKHYEQTDERGSALEAMEESHLYDSRQKSPMAAPYEPGGLEKLLESFALFQRQLLEKIEILEGRLSQLQRQDLPAVEPDVITPPLSGVEQTFPQRQERMEADLALVKKIARALGLYYMDRSTPHLVFTRALMEYAQSSNTDYLALVVETQLQIRQGENTVILRQNTYRVWKN